MDTKRGVALSYEACNISSSLIHELYGRLDFQICELKRIVADGNACKTPYAFLALPYDVSGTKQVISLVKSIQKHTPTLCIIIGIGGSSLGSRAVYDAIAGASHNFTLGSVQLCFLETVDPDTIENMRQRMLYEAEQGGSIILNVVSKSGQTTETIANFNILFAVLKICHPTDYSYRVIVTTDKDSLLAKCAIENNFSLLFIPDLVGGRYSVFSTVSLFPLALAGVDIEMLCLGAQRAIKDGLHDKADINKAAINACITYAHYCAGIHINDMFLFDPALQSIGLWWRQLIGESLGKQTTSDKKRVGILPTVSIGSADLHSVAQLYLGGPVKLFTAFIAVNNTENTVTIPNLPLCGKLISNIEGKTVSFIMNAILQGALQAYKENGNPFTVTTLHGKKEYNLGYFLQTKMLEVIYLAFFLDVNPFDQPDVERYKRITREILAHG